MAINDPLWWQVWWPWMLLWTAAVLAVALAALLAVYRWRSRARRGRLAVTFYLSTDAIMGMYQQLRYKPALQRAVREEIGRSANANVAAEFGPIRAGSGWQVDRRVFSTYIETDEPITVIGILMAVLEDTDDIVHVDLERLTLTPNRAARAAIARGADRARLRGLDAYVLVQGNYRRYGGGDADRTSFRAPYGEEPAGHATAAWVRIDCDREGLRRRVPDGAFPARCLGRVERWDADARELVIDPIAVFK